MPSKLVISTVVDTRYQYYMPLFIFCLKHYYPEYYIKIFTYGAISKVVYQALKIINKKFEIVEGLFDDWVKYKYSPISWRFAIPKEHYNKYDYVYITDIDMLILPEKITLKNFHLNEMGETGLCYSNSLRHKKHWRGTESLTGLHFAEKDWFRRTESARLKYSDMLRRGVVGEKREYDGHMLYLITKDSGVKLPPKLPLIDRHHGIHLGSFRLYSSPKKIIRRIDLVKCKKWLVLRENPEFKRIRTLVSIDSMVRTQLEMLDTYSMGLVGK